jgi:hypothetical protein
MIVKVIANTKVKGEKRGGGGGGDDFVNHNGYGMGLARTGEKQKNKRTKNFYC